MKISTKGRYALRFMLDMAQNAPDGKLISLGDIAKRQDISPKYLEQIVSMLVRAGFVAGMRGASGGYRLTRSPESYTVGQILRLTEGDLSPADCTSEFGCPRGGGCPAEAFWRGLYESVSQYVDTCTLADLIARSEEKRE